MISTLQGRVGHVGLDHLVLVVGGVGFHVHTTPATCTAQRVGAEVTLATSLVVREDSLTLYGFASDSERDMFTTVQTVSGVGPRLALAMLSVMGPADLAAALSTGNVGALKKIPGIGQKSAERLVLELRDKVGAPVGQTTDPQPGAASDQASQVEQALVGLGWSAKQAADTVAKVAASGQAGDVATMLRLSLRELGR